MIGRHVLSISFSQSVIRSLPNYHQIMLQHSKLERCLKGGHGNWTWVDKREKLAKAPILVNPSTHVGVLYSSSLLLYGLAKFSPLIMAESKVALILKLTVHLTELLLLFLAITRREANLCILSKCLKTKSLWDQKWF